MKQLFLGAALMIPVCAQAQEIPPFMYVAQPCENFLVVAQEVGSFGEQALFTGSSSQFSPTGTPIYAETMFFVNQDTGTWSMISVFDDGSACMMVSGINFEPWIAERR